MGQLGGMPRSSKPIIALPAGVHRVLSRGKDYYYWRPNRGTARGGVSIRLPHVYDPDFWTEVRRLSGDADVGKPSAGTFGALITDYQSSPEWSDLSPASKRDYGRYLEEINRVWGGLSVLHLKAEHVLKLRDSKLATPSSGNYLLRVLSTLVTWGIPRGFRSDNPCHHVKKLKVGDGWEPWPWDIIVLFRETARRDLWWAAAIALYTGQRQADVLAMKWSDIVAGTIAVVQEKTQTKVWIPVHRDLKPILDAIPKRSITVLTNRAGEPWTSSGFRATWRKDKANPEGLVFHGLRKSSVVFLLEAGCTDAEVSAITGQSRGMVEHYARMVNRKKLAAAAVLKWEKNVE